MEMEMDPTRVMIAVSDSKVKKHNEPSISSKRAFEWTIEKMVRSNKLDFKILFLHVQVPDDDHLQQHDIKIYACPDDFKDMTTNSKGLHLLHFFVNKCHEIGVGCEAWMKRGDPKDVICQQVTRVRPDLLVLGSRGLGRFQKVFVGSVSGYCVKHADCPVLTIKRNPDETPNDPADD
ncbi:unnamed protein product [Cochlearia groenlandica]